jgi:hypothetical protein
MPMNKYRNHFYGINYHRNFGPIEKHTKGHFNYIEPETVTSYLDRLNFKFIYNNSDLAWEVRFPTLEVMTLQGKLI